MDAPAPMGQESAKATAEATVEKELPEEAFLGVGRGREQCMEEDGVGAKEEGMQWGLRVPGGTRDPHNGVHALHSGLQGGEGGRGREAPPSGPLSLPHTPFPLGALLLPAGRAWC